MTSYLSSLALPAFFFENPPVSILLPVVMGAGIGYATRPDRTVSTYRALKQPPLHPPPWIFGPMWTFLYASMGYAAHRSWTAGITNNTFSPHTADLARRGAGLYTLQLGLNMIWMPLFFVLGRPVEATADIVVLTGLVGALAYTWSGVDEVSAWLMVPYIGWLSFATYLSAGCGYLNNWDFSSAMEKSKDV